MIFNRNARILLARAGTELTLLMAHCTSTYGNAALCMGNLDLELGCLELELGCLELELVCLELELGYPQA